MRDFMITRFYRQGKVAALNVFKVGFSSLRQPSNPSKNTGVQPTNGTNTTGSLLSGKQNREHPAPVVAAAAPSKLVL